MYADSVGTVLLRCITSGAVFTSLCAALSVPPLAWVAIRLFAPSIRAVQAYRLRSLLAAFGAVIPGFVFVALVAYGLTAGVSSACLRTPLGRFVFAILALLALSAIARSVFRAVKRRWEARALVAGSVPACGRLAAIAASVGVYAREILDRRDCVVMLYGMRHAAIYVSTGALRRLDDGELRAALHHELAHRSSGDHLIAPLLHFFSDLLPLPVRDLVAAHCRARELCADERALAHVDRVELASALLRLAREDATVPAAAAAFASRSGIVRDRLDALLRPRVVARRRPLTDGVLTLGLALVTIAALSAPAVATVLARCQGMPQ